MANQLAQLLDSVIEDPWRAEIGFSSDIRDAMRQMGGDDHDEAHVIDVLAEWLSKHQPCLFGRIAAKKNLVEYCVIGEEDIRTSDEAVRDKIKEARFRWYRRGWRGEASAFVLVVKSDRLARAVPNETVLAFARRLCGLFLTKEIQADQIYLDELFLQIPWHDTSIWKWVAGVNYFSAHGDGRWWQDHRVPAAMAFSVNSVGHFVRSSEVNKTLESFDEALGLPHDKPEQNKVGSLGKALDMAMRTIQSASMTTSGKATWLVPEKVGLGARPKCPIDLPKQLKGFDHCEYGGAYHTDVTIPSEYFRPDIDRPGDLPRHALDFTYIFHDDIENPDHALTGKGMKIRQPDGIDARLAIQRRRRMVPSEVRIENEPTLIEALRAESN
jgi:hypothetical protein